MKNQMLFRMGNTNIRANNGWNSIPLNEYERNHFRVVVDGQGRFICPFKISDCLTIEPEQQVFNEHWKITSITYKGSDQHFYPVIVDCNGTIVCGIAINNHQVVMSVETTQTIKSEDGRSVITNSIASLSNSNGSVCSTQQQAQHIPFSCPLVSKRKA